MNKRRAFLFLLLSFVLMISSFAVSANEQTISDTLKNMHVLSSHDFEKYDDSTPVDDTDFSEDWNITYGGGEAFVYDAEGKKMLASHGSTITSNGDIQFELDATSFKENEGYAVSTNQYVPLSGANTVGYVFLRGFEVMEDIIELNWFTKDREGGAFRGGSGVSFRWQSSGKFEVAVRFYDQDSNTCINTAYVRLAVDGIEYGKEVNFVYYDNGVDRIDAYADDKLVAYVEYSNPQTLKDENNNITFVSCYTDVRVYNAEGTLQNLTYIDCETGSNVSIEKVDNALLSVDGLVAISHSGRLLYYDDITVYSVNEPVVETPAPTQAPTTEPTTEPNAVPTTEPAQTSEPTETSAPADSTDSDNDKDDNPFGVIAIIASIAVIIIVIAIVIIIIKKNKK